jgi:hypothetical protein
MTAIQKYMSSSVIRPQALLLLQGNIALLDRICNSLPFHHTS